jgi:peptidoglycan/LPS O-acetylase OafA/YrhL
MASRAAIAFPDHIPALDGLRGIAILLVLAVHTEMPVTLEPLLKDGWVGVDLFFVLSGFLITRILLKSRNSPRYVTNFYARRILRIWPVYFGIVLFVFACERFGLVWAHATTWGWLTLATFTQNFYIGAYGWDSLPDWLGPTWSLGIEEQFYLVWPLLVRTLSVATLKRVCLTVIFITPLIRALVAYYLHHDDGTLVLTFCRLDTLCFGTLLAIGFESGDLRFSNWVQRLLLPALALFIILEKFASQLICETFLYSLLAIAFAGSLALCLAPIPAVSNRFALAFFSFGPLRFIGKISYCLYLIHRAVFALAASHTSQRILSQVPGYQPNGWLQLAINWALSLLIATLSWYLYESPILKLKRRFADLPQPAETRAAAAV